MNQKQEDTVGQGEAGQVPPLPFPLLLPSFLSCPPLCSPCDILGAPCSFRLTSHVLPHLLGGGAASASNGRFRSLLTADIRTRSLLWGRLSCTT